LTAPLIAVAHTLAVAHTRPGLALHPAHPPLL